MDPKCTLKEETLEFSDIILCDCKGEESVITPSDFCLSNWKDEVTDNRDRDSCNRFTGIGAGTAEIRNLGAMC